MVIVKLAERGALGVHFGFLCCSRSVVLFCLNHEGCAPGSTCYPHMIPQDQCIMTYTYSRRAEHKRAQSTERVRLPPHPGRLPGACHCQTIPIHRHMSLSVPGAHAAGMPLSVLRNSNPNCAAVARPVASRHKSTPSRRATATIAFLRRAALARGSANTFAQWRTPQ